MARHFIKSSGVDWLSAYQLYATDEFCPPSFHTWTGIGLISAACERRMWIDHGRYKIYPNLYVLMISRPGVGKTTAINIGVDNILVNLRHRQSGEISSTKGINFISQQSSEAGFYSPQLERKREFYVGNQKHIQTPGFMSFDEGANSLKEISGGGSIMKGLTKLYDCPNRWTKSLTGRPEIVLENIYLSMLAGCTFADLPGIIPREHLEGGLASRFIFIPEFERSIRRPLCKSKAIADIMRDKLTNDLQDIYEMSGEIKIEESFHSEWSERHALNDEKLNQSANSQIECLLARRFLNIEKLSLIVSISESNAKIITKEHWNRAEALYDAQANLLPKILEYSNVGEDQKTMVDAIRRFIDEGNKNRSDLELFLYKAGIDPFRIKANIDFSINQGLILVSEDGMLTNKIAVNHEIDIAIVSNTGNVQAEPLPAQVTH